MPKKFIAGLLIGTTVTITSSYFFINKLNTSNPINLTQANAVSYYQNPLIRVSHNTKWTTVDKIEQSLKNMPPMNVGFDIDDTVLFTMPTFKIYHNKYCPKDTEPYRPTCSHQSAFWDSINTSDNLNGIKQVGRDLIEMHKRRGDTIYFITAREKSVYKQETTTEVLKKIFKINNLNPTIFLGFDILNPSKPRKTEAIKENNIRIFYGDSDSDIAAAKAANIRGIRVLRAANSHDNDIMPNNGCFGEEVIMGSDV